jgi:hypothetical protein
VAQASSQWRNLVSLVQNSPLAEIDLRDLKHVSWQRWSAPGGWLLFTGGTIGLLFWNGRLVVATGAGVAVMLLVYLMQDGNWKAPWADLRKFLQGWNRQFLLAVASGGAATFGTYLAASLWAEVGSPWIATGMLLQQAATMGAVGLLIWQMMGKQPDRPITRLNQILDDLTDADPLKRLIAVRRMSEVLKKQPDRAQQRQLADYLRVMLSREEEPIVRDAVLEGLQTLNTARSLAPSRTQPLEATAMKRSTSKIRKRVPMP